MTISCPSVFPTIIDLLAYLDARLTAEKDHIVVSRLDGITEAALRCAIETLKYAPIISQNRVEGHFAFTVVPLIKPPFFDREEILPIEGLRGDALWETVAKAETTYRRGMAITYDIPIAGTVLTLPVFFDLRKYWGWFASIRASFTGVPPVITECVAKYESPGIALDLGCGKGSASIAMCRKGWEVTAVDSSVLALEVLHAKANEENEAWLREGKLKTVANCVTSFDFSEKYDVVVVYDVLSFIPAAKLREVFGKIFGSLKPEGRVVGCMFFTGDGYPYEEHFKRKGASFLPDVRLIVNMLLDTGFVLEVVQKRLMEAEVPSEAVEFCALKPVV